MVAGPCGRVLGRATIFVSQSRTRDKSSHTRFRCSMPCHAMTRPADATVLNRTNAIPKLHRRPPEPDRLYTLSITHKRVAPADPSTVRAHNKQGTTRTLKFAHQFCVTINSSFFAGAPSSLQYRTISSREPLFNHPYKLAIGVCSIVGDHILGFVAGISLAPHPSLLTSILHFLNFNS